MILNVVHTANGYLQTGAITEYDNDEQGAVVNFLQRAAGLEAEVTVLDAEIKILDDQLNVYQGNSRHITHAKIEGYLSDGKFYSDTEHTLEITGRNDTLYVDITDAEHPVNYKWNGSAFVRA